MRRYRGGCACIGEAASTVKPGETVV